MEDAAFDWMHLYAGGMFYFIIALFSAFVLFTLYRYKQAVTHYIKNGELENPEYSWFFTKRWLFAGEEISKHHIDDYFHSNPFVATMDLVFAAFFILLGSLIWPLVITVGSVIFYAKMARIRYRRKKEFLDRLAGEHAEA